MFSKVWMHNVRVEVDMKGRMNEFYEINVFFIHVMLEFLFVDIL